MSQLLDAVDAASIRSDIPNFRPGDTVRVHVKVVEGTRERVQVFEGVVIAVNGTTGLHTSFTVRRMSHGVGVERTFLVHSPRLDRIEVLRHGDVRRAKLYYLRDKVGKRARIRERREPLGGSSRVNRREAAPTADGAAVDGLIDEAPVRDAGAEAAPVEVAGGDTEADNG